MSIKNSLIYELPKIVDEGKREVEKILDNLLQEPCETEVLEFKTAKNNFDFRKLGKYFSALSNEANLKSQKCAWLIFGVSNNQNITGTNYRKDKKFLQSLKHEIAQTTTNNISFIDIYSVDYDDGRVVMFKIPPAPQGIPIAFKGHYYSREGESLSPLGIDKIEEIRNQNKNIDWSTLENEDAKFNDLDEKAIEIIKQKWIEKSGNKDLEKLRHQEILKKLLLVKNNKITNACLLLVGKQEILAKLIPASEIFLEWRLDGDKIEYDIREIVREPYIIAQDKIWNFINSRNTRVPFKKGFFEFDIWAYDEQSIREAILNAFAHREYVDRTEPIYVRVSPDKVVVKSPGGFLPGVNLDNILDVEGKWRNRLLMDALARIGLVDRAGMGLDRIFKIAISQGKGLPDFNGTTSEYVILNVPAKIKDLNFVYYLQKIEEEKQIQIDTVKDFIELEKIRITGKIDDKEKQKHFYMNGIIEKVGIGRGTRYILSKNFYEFIDKRSEHIRKRWLNKDEQKKMILNYLKTYKKGKVSDFKQLFKEKELSNQQINKFLKELAIEGVYFDGKQRSPKAFWKIKEKG